MDKVKEGILLGIGIFLASTLLQLGLSLLMLGLSLLLRAPAV